MSASSADLLLAIGWSAEVQAALAALGRPELVGGRVVRQDRKTWLLASTAGELVLEAPGRLRRELSAAELPTVGDWIAAEPLAGGERAQLVSILPRKSAIVRHVAGLLTEPQVLAANVDTLFLVSGLDRDYNPRRLERFLTLAHQSGAAPVLVLNKADICADLAECVAETEAIAQGVPVLVTSAREGAGVDEVRRRLGPGRTGAFLGSSGVGKSTLVNALLGEERMATGAVRENDQRGRHVTTRRELVVLPEGLGCVIDTPGLREVQLWADADSLSAAFADVEQIAQGCRFADCTHEVEPGCAVRAAVETGELAGDRFDSYVQLRAEVTSLEKRSKEHEVRAAGRRLSKAIRAYEKIKKGEES